MQHGIGGDILLLAGRYRRCGKLPCMGQPTGRFKGIPLDDYLRGSNRDVALGQLHTQLRVLGDDLLRKGRARCGKTVQVGSFLVEADILALLEVAGSPKAWGYFSLAPQPSMLSCMGVKVFHRKSRVLTTRFLPPKMPSMSDVMLGFPDKPEPM